MSLRSHLASNDDAQYQMQGCFPNSEREERQMMMQVLYSGYEPVEQEEQDALVELSTWRELWDQVLSGFAWLG